MQSLASSHLRITKSAIHDTFAARPKRQLYDTSPPDRRLCIPAEWSEDDSSYESSYDKPESEILYYSQTPVPQIVGALILGIKGDRWPRRRSVPLWSRSARILSAQISLWS